MIETHWNSPSIIMWVVFNEGQGEFDAGRLAGMVKALDPSRLVNEASGFNITGAGDVNDLHLYPGPGVRTPTPNQALANGEMGRIGYKVAGHIWNANEVGNYAASSPDDLLYLYAEYMNDVKDLRDKKGLSAVVYTEITDVMQELVGLMTYDRVRKVDPTKIALANHFMLKMPSYIALVPTSEQTGQDWRYTTTKPADNWTTAGYSDAQWLEKKGGFGAGTDHAGTSWTTSDIWMRRHFTPGSVSADQTANLVLRDLHMGAVEVFINGVRAYSQRGRSNSWEYRGVSSEARTSIRANADNVLSVHCARAANSQFIDVDLSERIGSYQ